MTYYHKSISYLLILAIFIGHVTVCLSQQKNCEVVHDGVDLQTKEYRIELAPDLWFNYTPPQIKNELQEDNLINTTAQLVKVEDVTTLHLNMKVNSLQAQKAYGSIDAGDILKITMINGREVNLKCYAGSSGVMNQNRKSFIYPVGYTLEKSDLRVLAKKEIDKIGIQWSSGYEEYTIYEVDFFMNQISCLKQIEDQKPN